MQPMTPPARKSAAARYIPLAVIVLLAAAVAVVLATRKGDDSSAPATTVPAATTAATTAPGVTAPGGTTTPPTSSDPSQNSVLTFAEAKAKGITNRTFLDTCDPKTGFAALPFHFTPPCYANVADNGGDTSMGVTRDSIKVVFYEGPQDDLVLDFLTSAINNNDTLDQIEQTMAGYEELLQKYFQTYGRKVDIVPFRASGSSTDEVAARADAAKVAAMKPFAVFGGPVLVLRTWIQEMAAYKIVCLCGGGTDMKTYADHAPYLWDLAMNPEQGQIFDIEYLGKRIINRPAQYAGDPALKTQTRKLGLLYIDVDASSAALVDTFKKGLKDYNAELAEVVPYVLDPVRLQEQATSAIARLKGAGVTTVLFSGDPVAPATFTTEATAQNYFPEWLITNVALVDTTAFARTYDQKQWAHAFGVTQLTARIDPNLTAPVLLYEWFHGTKPPAYISSGVIAPFPTVFFGGVQAAGPNLTPESFRDALFSGNFLGQLQQGPVLDVYYSFGEHGLWSTPDYSGTDDLAEIWWDPEATGVDEVDKAGKGMYRYVDGGKRYLPGQWPEGEPKLFDPAGAVTIYDTRPPTDAIPDYPPPR